MAPPPGPRPAASARGARYPATSSRAAHSAPMEARVVPPPCELVGGMKGTPEDLKCVNSSVRLLMNSPPRSRNCATPARRGAAGQAASVSPWAARARASERPGWSHASFHCPRAPKSSGRAVGRYSTSAARLRAALPSSSATASARYLFWISLMTARRPYSDAGRLEGIVFSHTRWIVARGGRGAITMGRWSIVATPSTTVRKGKVLRPRT
mmetsp:Transcript_37860/g.119455  ORF Transcript_37860/g.119455 Transcript_37860/m.119455 type:complete len:211 (-) Transcript_37860:687-1319(-)